MLTACTALLGLLLLPSLNAGQQDGAKSDYAYGDKDTGTYRYDSANDPANARQSSSTTSNIALEQIYSGQTGMFVAITKSSRINAHANRGEYRCDIEQLNLLIVHPHSACCMHTIMQVHV